MRLRTEVALAAGLGAFGLLVLWSLRAPSPPCRSPQPTPGPPAPPAPRAPGAPRAPRAPCRANASAAAQPDFAGQPQQVRDFLLYRHCRDFALLQDAPAKCAEPVFLLLAIKSSPANYERRELLRRTWARERRVRGAPLRRLFLLGTAADPREARKVDRLLALEARAHGDILQWDFHDSFFNLTLKQVGQPGGPGPSAVLRVCGLLPLGPGSWAGGPELPSRGRIQAPFPAPCLLFTLVDRSPLCASISSSGKWDKNGTPSSEGCCEGPRAGVAGPSQPQQLGEGGGTGPILSV